MDIIDIMLARALTPQGKTEAYVAKANKAAQKAAKAEEDAATAIATVESAADEIATARERAAALLEEAQGALETAQSVVINMPEVYTTTGQNTDGYMTQKAVTDALDTKASVTYVNNQLNLKADATVLNNYATTTYVNNGLSSKVDTTTLNNYATKQYVTQQISSIPSGGSEGGGSINYGIDNEGHIIIIGEGGTAIAGSVTEEDLIEALIKSGTYTAEGVIGINIDYENKSVMRIQEAYGKEAGNDFNAYAMYGGRMRCNVADDGTINAFYGDPTYADDGSNGEVMIYQPKFYYERVPTKVEYGSTGVIIRKETLLISPTFKAGFKIHPLFINENNEEVDYVLLSAYETSILEDVLHSRANQKPITNITIEDAETLAKLHGAGWHITNLAFESAIQMLEIVEFGTMNGQLALEKGICTINDVGSYNCASITGSTASLGNTTGVATETVNEINGNRTTYNANGKRAISYRGMENPWGNAWRMIGGMKIVGSGSNAGTPFINTSLNYANVNNYKSVGFSLSSTQGWISAMGYGGKEFDWIYIPIECLNGNSATPVGDNIWVMPNLNSENVAAVGGKWSFEEGDGPFSYAFDSLLTASSQKSYSVRLMCVPIKDSIYTTNISKWTTKMEG